MSDPTRWTGQMPSTRQQQQQPSGDGTNLADILERVLDKGIVIAGDIQINLLDIELLTIKLRLIVASVDRAKEMGIDWWERDPTLSSGHRELEDENKRLRERLEAIEGAAPALANGHAADVAPEPAPREAAAPKKAAPRKTATRRSAEEPAPRKRRPRQAEPEPVDVEDAELVEDDPAPADGADDSSATASETPRRRTGERRRPRS